MSDKTLLDFLPEITGALAKQLVKDQERWKDTWKKRPREGQEDRIYARFRDYYDQWKNAEVPIPWLKIIGEALIGWMRENHPEELIVE
jgi:hypothetical protein